MREPTTTDTTRCEWFFTAPTDPVLVRRGDSLGFRSVANSFADEFAPGLSGRTRDARWIRSTTLRDATSSYLADSAGRRKPSTITGYQRVLEMMAREPWSAHDLREIDYLTLKSWIAKRRAAGASGATVNRNLCVLSSLFRWAIREGYTDSNPVARIPRFSEKGREREVYLSDSEARALVAAADAEFRGFLVCALATGMRKGEIRRLSWGSVDLERRTVTVEPEHAKSGRARTIPISAWLSEEIQHLLADRPAPRPSAHVFGRADGTPYDDWDIRRRLIAAKAACTEIAEEKKPKVTMHTLRHTAASLMVAAGVPIFDVAKVLGHSSVLVTMRYAHFAPEAGRAAIDALDRRLRPAPSADRVAEGAGRSTGQARGGAPNDRPAGAAARRRLRLVG